MHSYESLPFHKAYPVSSFLEEAKIMEKERELMFSYLPEEYRRIQSKVEEVCDQMEYEGSRMYDEHPDRDVMRHMAKRIMKELSEDCNFTEDMVCCFLSNEIMRRRYRTWFGKRYIR